MRADAIVLSGPDDTVVAAVEYEYTESAHAAIEDEFEVGIDRFEDTMDELIAEWPAWLRFEQPTPGLLIGGLLLFVVLAVLGLCLVRIALVLIHPAVRLLDSLRRVAHDALHARAGDRWPRVLKLLEREVAEILLVAIAAAVLLASGGLLIWLALAVAAETPLVRVDQAVFAWLQQGRQDWLDVAMTAITEFGGARISVAIGIAVFGWLAWRRAWAAAVYWTIALIGARACVLVLKYGLARAAGQHLRRRGVVLVSERARDQQHGDLRLPGLSAVRAAAVARAHSGAGGDRDRGGRHRPVAALSGHALAVRRGGRLRAGHGLDRDAGDRLSDTACAGQALGGAPGRRGRRRGARDGCVGRRLSSAPQRGALPRCR